MQKTLAKDPENRLSAELLRKRGAATREILEVISKNRDDEGPVFDVILRRVADLCAADALCLILAKAGDRYLRMVASHGIDPATVAFYQGERPMDPEISATAEAILSGETIHIENMMDTEGYRGGLPAILSTVHDSGILSDLIVPLMSSAGGIGAIVVSRKEVRPFSDDDIALVETFAAQAVIAIENVRQFRELQTRLEREAATREILEVISQSRDDDAPVFDAILRRAADLCGAKGAALILGKPEDTHPRIRAVSVGVDAATIAFYERGDVPMDPKRSSAAKAILTGKVVHIEDMMDTEGYRRGIGLAVSAVRDSGIRTTMFVPLLTASGGIGCLHLFRKEVRPYTHDEIALVETFAAQAVIAIENVRQFRELQTRLAREAATREILEVISHSRDDDRPVFDMVLRKAAQLCGASLADLCVISEDRSHAVVAAHWGEMEQQKIAVGDPIGTMDSEAAIPTCMREGRIVEFDDLADTDLYRSGDPIRVTAVDKEGIRTFLAVPLLSGGRAVGCIAIYRLEVRPFTADQIALVETFAAQAAIAIENVRQFKALEALNAELGDRVQEQVGEIERMGRLKRFLPAAVANTVISSGSEKLLSSHRAMLGVLFCDIRGFTAFCETAEPEETIEVLQTYHEEMGKLINAHGAGVDHRMGDGIMVLFNDPLPCDDPAGDAVRLAMAMRARMAELCQKWKRLGHRLGFGLGVSLGYATVGMVGFEGRFDYTASGTAINLASRLCDEAQDGEILLSPRASAAVESSFTVESRGEITLKGIREPVEVFRLTGAAA